ncbi:hypothetical protein AB0P21_40205 [Kribbella sp. NPDC056861]|uniref:hypothetical protein n=1 Tax=Kribbella sp. NPDC056861 TaxID=3154857 RepID=UPI003443EF1D
MTRKRQRCSRRSADPVTSPRSATSCRTRNLARVGSTRGAELRIGRVVATPGGGLATKCRSLPYWWFF